MSAEAKHAAARFRQWPNLYYYARGKLALDPAFPVVAGLLRDSAQPLLDLGCGMGLLAAYLRACGHRAPISGLDVDAEKIAVARTVLAGEEADFHVGDAGNFPPHTGDVVMLDVLHYFDDQAQATLLERMAASVGSGGRLVVRVTLKDRSWRFAATRLEEWWVHFSRWIPVKGGNFPTHEEMLSPFGSGWRVELRPMWGVTPFNSYLLTAARVPEAPQG